MARVFITGSSSGLGLLAGQLLARQGHEVVLHARDEAKEAQARASLPTCSGVVNGDVSTLAGIAAVAEQAKRLGPFDAVIHNVAMGVREPRRVETADGLSQLFVVNVVAPYLLTARLERPQRLVYLSSGLHRSGDGSLDDLQWEKRRWNGLQAYSDSKLHDTILAMAVARHWPDVRTNAVDPGWVPTRMGGPGAPDDLVQGAVTQAWLAVSDEPAAQVTGRYLHHQQPRPMHPVAERPEAQDRLVDALRALTGIALF